MVLLHVAGVVGRLVHLRVADGLPHAELGVEGTNDDLVGILVQFRGQAVPHLQARRSGLVVAQTEPDVSAMQHRVLVFVEDLDLHGQLPVDAPEIGKRISKGRRVRLWAL